MSRSKRAAGGDTAPVPRESVKWYRQTGWLLAVSLVCCTIVTVGLRLALGAAFTGLFRAWGVDAATVTRAPTWAQLFYRWHGSAVTLVSAIALIGLSMWLRGLWTGSGALPPPARRDGGDGLRSAARPCTIFALIGLAAAALVLAVSILPDSIRAEWAAPRLAWALPVMLVVAFISTLAEELFTKRVLYDGIASRWGTLWATLVSAAGFFLMAGGYAGNVLSAVNVALLGSLCCLVYARNGLWAGVGLRFGWTAATVFLMGFGGGEASVWRFYGVSEGLLTGGDAGPVYGLYMTILLIIGVVRLAWKKK